MLRITDVLNRNLILGTVAYDAQHSNDIEEELERPMISKLIENIRSCGVSFKVYPKKSGEYEFTSLVGNDKKKLLEKLPKKLVDYQPKDCSKDVKALGR